METDEVRDSSHQSKKRKHADSEHKSSSKKRKGLDPDLADATDTPTKKSKSKKSSKPRKPIAEHLPSPSPQATTHATLQRGHDISIPDAPIITNEDTATSTTTTSSPFHLITSSLYLPIPAISLSPHTALSSLLTTHLTPLLLTYFPPLRGIILSITDPILSARKPRPDDPPTTSPSSSSTPTVLAQCADDAGHSYVWLTASFLVFRPGRGDELEGWVNVCSDGFVGLVCYNYFQVAVPRGRIPRDWRWVLPGGEAGVGEKRGKVMRKEKEKKGREREREAQQQQEEEEQEQEEKEEGKPASAAADSQMTLVSSSVEGQEAGKGANGAGTEDGTEDGAEAAAKERENGYFVRPDGTRVKGATRFRVVDCEIVPGHDRDTWSLQLEGTLLSAEDEGRVMQEERQQALGSKEKAMVMGRPGAGLGSLDGAVGQSGRGTANRIGGVVGAR